MTAKQVGLYLAQSDLERVERLKPYAADHKASAVYREALRRAFLSDAVVISSHLEDITPIRSSVVLSERDYGRLQTVMARSPCTSLGETIRALVFWLDRHVRRGKV